MSPEDETSARAEIDHDVVEALGFEPTDATGRRRGSVTEQISDAGFAVTDVLDSRTRQGGSNRNGSTNGSGSSRRSKRSRRRRRNRPGTGPSVPVSTEDDELEAELLRREAGADEDQRRLGGDGPTGRDGFDRKPAGGRQTTDLGGSPAIVGADGAGEGGGAPPDVVLDDGPSVVSAPVSGMAASRLPHADEATDGDPGSKGDQSSTRLGPSSGDLVDESVDVVGERPGNSTVEMSAVESAMVTPTEVDRSGDGIVIQDPAAMPRADHGHMEPVPSRPPNAVVAEAPPVGPAGPAVIEPPSSPAITGPHPVVRIDEADAQRGLIERPPSLGDLFGGWPGRRQRLEARKVRRVVRHIDPWSVLTFSVLFHLCVFAALLLASVLVWNVAEEAGTIENLENFILELGDYESFEINGEAIFRAALAIAGIFTLAASVLVVLLTVMFNLLSDLIGGVRVTVIEEETVRVRPADQADV